MTIDRVTMHWTAGTHTANRVDRQHYHRLYEGDGAIVLGDHTPEDNRDTSDHVYARHTANLNTRNLGVALCAMRDAREAPFHAGSHPITRAQVDAMVRDVAAQCLEYGVPVTRQTVLTHAEVERTLGVAQKQKWDITWLPGMTRPGDAIEVGDTIREMIREEMIREAQRAMGVASPTSAPPVAQAPVTLAGLIKKVIAWLASRR